jgi:hypothetical protein
VFWEGPQWGVWIRKDLPPVGRSRQAGTDLTQPAIQQLNTEMASAESLIMLMMVAALVTALWVLIVTRMWIAAQLLSTLLC